MSSIKLNVYCHYQILSGVKNTGAAGKDQRDNIDKKFDTDRDYQ
jgi:hypothetical protein